MAITDSLVSYWKLNEASGNALDAHGSNHLTDNNTVGSAAGKINTARDFEDGSSEYFSLSDNANLSTGDIDFTFAGWVKLKSKPGNQMGIAGKGDIDGAADHNEWGLLWDNSTDRFYFAVLNGISSFGFVPANTIGAPSTGVWYFIVAWHDATANTVNIQVNDGTVDSLSYSAGSWNSTYNFVIGNIFPAVPRYWDGLIDECGFWKRVLTSGERTQLYNSGSGLTYPFSSFAVSPTAIPTNHPGNISLKLTGSGTSWDETTVFALSGVAGVNLVSQQVFSPTSAEIVVTTD